MILTLIIFFDFSNENTEFKRLFFVERRAFLMLNFKLEERIKPNEEIIV